jgi:hypothetical protein
MIDHELVQAALQPPEGWEDTPEQARLRACLTTVLTGHEPADTIRICYDIITLMRDQLMTQTASVRRSAAKIARDSMSPKELSVASGQTPQTISRLLSEARSA